MIVRRIHSGSARKTETEDFHVTLSFCDGGEGINFSRMGRHGYVVFVVGFAGLWVCWEALGVFGLKYRDVCSRW